MTDQNVNDRVPAPSTEAGGELVFYLHGALIAYPDDRAEAILTGAKEYIVKAEEAARAEGCREAVRVERLAVELEREFLLNVDPIGLTPSWWIERANAILERVAGLNASESGQPPNRCPACDGTGENAIYHDDPMLAAGVGPCAECNGTGNFKATDLDEAMGRLFDHLNLGSKAEREAMPFVWQLIAAAQSGQPPEASDE